MSGWDNDYISSDKIWSEIKFNNQAFVQDKYNAYRKKFEAFKNRPKPIRTLDKDSHVFRNCQLILSANVPETITPPVQTNEIAEKPYKKSLVDCEPKFNEILKQIRLDLEKNTSNDNLIELRQAVTNRTEQVTELFQAAIKNYMMDATDTNYNQVLHLITQLKGVHLSFLQELERIMISKPVQQVPEPKSQLELESLVGWESKFNETLKHIHVDMQKIASNETLKVFRENVYKKMKQVWDLFKVAVQKCAMETTDANYNEVLRLVQQIKCVHLNLLKELERIEISNLNEIQSVKQLPVSVPQPQPQPQSQSQQPIDCDHNKADALAQKYWQAIEFISSTNNQLNELTNSKDLESFRFDLKKGINIPLNSLSTATPEHLIDKFLKLAKLLKGEYVAIGNNRFSAKQHPHGILFCKDLLAKMFIKQGDFVASKNAETIFGYATVILALWTVVPDLGTHLVAHFYQQCPYLVPFDVRRQPNQSEIDFWIRIGYKFADNQIEDDTKFLQRMSGIARLYALLAIVQLPVTQQKIQRPFALNVIWEWLGDFLRSVPEHVELSACILLEFLQTTAFELLRVYQNDFVQIVLYIKQVYLPELKKRSSGGPVIRLELYLKEEKFERPAGMLPERFW